MAATTLGLLSPSTQFSQMNVHQMLFGVKPQRSQPSSDGLTAQTVFCGSLELLDTPAPKAGEPIREERRLFQDWAGQHADTGEHSTIGPYSQHLVIMNPPYTRDSLRYDQLGDADEQAMKAREKVLMAGRAGHGSSSGTMFMDLGHHLVRPDDGATLAIVFPLAGAAAPSALKVRRLLAEWFHVEWVVCSHDASRTWFSENTAIAEMLVVCRRPSAGAVPLAAALEEGKTHPTPRSQSGPPNGWWRVNGCRLG